MDAKQVINHRQICWLVGSLITGGGLLLVQHELIRVSRNDAWFSYLLPMLYAIWIGLLFRRLSTAFPGSHLFEISKLLAGKLLGSLINLAIVVHIWFVLIRDCRALAQFFNTALLPNTPETIILLLFCLTLLYFGTTSIEVIARVNDIFFPIFFMAIVSLPLLLANEVRLYLVEPVLTTTFSSFISGSILSAGWHSDVIVIGAFLHTVYNSKQLSVSVRRGVILGSVLLTLMMLMEILVFGYNMPGNMIYPNYMLVQQINITDFLDRMDLFLLGTWFPVLTCKVVLIYLAFLTGVASFVGKRDYTLLNKPALLFVLVTSILGFKSTTEVFDFGKFGTPAITAYQLVALPLLYVLAVVKTKPAKQAGPDKRSSPDSGHKEQSPSRQLLASMTRKMSFRSLLVVAAALSVICLGCIVIGLMYGRQHSAVGVACGVLYALCLLLLVVNSLIEMLKAKNLK